MAFDDSQQLAVLDLTGVKVFPYAGTKPVVVSPVVRGDNGTALAFRPGTQAAVAVSTWPGLHPQRQDFGTGTVLLTGGAADRWHTGHTSRITAMAFTRDGTQLFTASTAGTIRFVPSAPGVTVPAPLDSTYLNYASEGITAIALPVGSTRRIVATNGNLADVWTLASGVLLVRRARVAPGADGDNDPSGSLESAARARGVAPVVRRLTAIP